MTGNNSDVRRNSGRKDLSTLSSKYAPIYTPLQLGLKQMRKQPSHPFAPLLF